MKTIRNFKVYNSIRELPINRFWEFEKYILQESGLGSGLSAVNKHLSSLDNYLKDGAISNAIKERENLHYTLFLTLEKLSPKSLAFACLIHSINGELCEDLTEEGLKETLTNCELNHGEVEDYFMEQKKNLILK
jgi:hypothetical protein